MFHVKQSRMSLKMMQRFLSGRIDLQKVNFVNDLEVLQMTAETGSFTVKKGLAQMLKGGVIMDVVTPEHARIAEDAGACAVMALERVPADIRAEGGVARMSDPELILKIMDAVTIPVMAKARIGHFVEAQILEALGVDYVDESEVLTPADEENHIYKHDFKIPFVCGCRNLGEALRRVGEGAAMIRTKRLTNWFWKPRSSAACPWSTSRPAVSPPPRTRH
jgi:pyridoxal 5'-phosphate synthase pdxS subunit